MASVPIWQKMGGPKKGEGNIFFLGDRENYFRSRMLWIWEWYIAVLIHMKEKLENTRSDEWAQGNSLKNRPLP